MPFRALPSGDFVSRENECGTLVHLAESGGAPPGSTLLLGGSRGIGKTELLKQVHRTFFWEDRNVVPFYYSFRTANLKITHFARDYFSRFIRQFLAYIRRDPSLAEGMGVSFNRLFPLISSLKLGWVINCIDDFEEILRGSDIHAQILAALSAPVTVAAKTGKTVLVMLDDFPLTARLYEEVPGDAPGLASLFGEVLSAPQCPHIITGSPQTLLESLFGDPSLRSRVVRMTLGPLSDDASFSLISSLCAAQEIRVHKETLFPLLRCLEGSPLYLRNMARALGKAQKKELLEKDLWECYGREIAEGETAFYWTSILAEFLPEVGQRKISLELLVHSLRQDGELLDAASFSRVLGIPERMLNGVLEGIRSSGVVHPGLGFRVVKDNVFRDFISLLHRREVEGREAVREFIGAKYGTQSTSSSFEMTIPIDADAELVAARAMEQIGRNMHLKPEEIRHLQVALIESCVNAMEHSGSQEKKIFLTFTISSGRAVVTIESPGKFFDPAAAEAQSIEEKLNSGHKREGSVKLLRSIMDEVKVERVGDRTRVTLIKKVKQAKVYD
ncbi:MAG: ATP-binding protein [Alphaproteobacteria bacterium]|uniref:ATP-binding protein n=1 Tax=Candidatus Nitrobium versatile TaxID=2884831 RepID=A0A953M143_9BACT|nr:ATP-binding protein [Candidatus Nitrobium versatile]